MLCRSAHLTNDAIQKKLDTYNQFEDHCKMDMPGLQVSEEGRKECWRNKL